MFRNYFKIGYRNLLRNKGYSAINIGGLAVGLSAAMIIGLWIHDELSYNKYHHGYDRVAKVMHRFTRNGETGVGDAIPLPLYSALAESYREDFKYLVVCSWTDQHILSQGEKTISRSGNFMSPAAPRLLDMTMLDGSLDGLQNPNAILLSRSTALALFGNINPMGKLMRIDNTYDAQVAGVFEDLPSNSEFNTLTFVAAWELMASQPWVKQAETQWGNHSFQLFAQVADNKDVESVSAKIKNVRLDKGDERDKILKPEVFLHPMKDWHLRSNWENGVQKGAEYVWLFGIIGIFVLVLACINFMNLSTARSEKRAKEVGIRKSIGSGRKELIQQFFTESFLVAFISFFVAIALVTAAIPAFNKLTEKSIAFPFQEIYFWVGALAILVIAGTLAGSYPSLFLSSFQPIKVLKGRIQSAGLHSAPRQILVVFQFTISVVLIIGTTVVYQQIQFIQARALGYDDDKVVMIQMTSPDFSGKYNVLRDELKREGAVQEMAESSSPLTAVWSNNSGFSWEGKDPSLQDDFATIWVSHDYGKTIGWNIVKGRDFSREVASDSSGIIINESAVKFMGLENPVGSTVRWGDAVNGQDFTIVGVVKDVLMESPSSAVKQAIYLVNYEHLNWIQLKLAPGQPVNESLAKAEKVFKKLLPGIPFDYQFADQEFAKKFAAEKKVGALAAIFSALAISISCLGLFGLASFVAEQRTKEIGIRKVLGASVIGLWKMLSKEFAGLSLVAAIIAIPFAYYFMNKWLLNYDYRIEISWLTFLFAIVGSIILTLLTVSFQAVKAAMMNPVKSLRSE
jgi:putative ABC transport system permease protein